MNTWTRVTMASVVKPSLTVYYVEADDDTVTEGFHHAHEVGDVNDPRIIVKNAQERGFSIILASEVTDIRDGYPNITYNYMEKIERLVMDEEYPFGPDASKRIAPRGRCQWLHAFGGECRCTPKGVFTVSANNNRNLRMVIMELGLLLYYNLGRHEFMLLKKVWRRATHILSVDMDLLRDAIIFFYIFGARLTTKEIDMAAVRKRINSNLKDGNADDCALFRLDACLCTDQSVWLRNGLNPKAIPWTTEARDICSLLDMSLPGRLPYHDTLACLGVAIDVLGETWPETLAIGVIAFALGRRSVDNFLRVENLIPELKTASKFALENDIILRRTVYERYPVLVNGKGVWYDASTSGLRRRTVIFAYKNNSVLPHWWSVRCGDDNAIIAIAGPDSGGQTFNRHHQRKG